MGRTDLIGNGKKHLIPAWQPEGTGLKAEKEVSRQKTEQAKVNKKKTPVRSKNSSTRRKPKTSQRRRT